MITKSFLRRMHLFEPLNEEQRERISQESHEIHLGPGQALFSQGEPAHQFFLVIEGMIKLFLLSREGDEKVIEVIPPGKSFAEAVMFMEPAKYPVNASAVGDTRLLAFENRIFLDLLEGSPALTRKLLATMSRRLHALLQEIDELTLHNATYRLVTYLLQQDRRGEGLIDLSVPKQLVASRLSIKPETLSRILARLRERGLVQIDGERIKLLDEPGLRAELER
jgi:CRP-like cAMP-binding protein